MEDITNVNYTHTKRVCKDVKAKMLGEYLDLYGESCTLQLADVQKNFQKMCLEIYEFDPDYFCSVLGLTWQAALKK